MANIVNTQNGAEDSFTLTSFLLTSIFYERKKQETSECQPLANVIKEVLTKSGISLHGIEALQIHAEIFTNIFIRQKEEASYEVSADEFFCSILDEQLGWFPFLTEIVSSLRLPVANKFLNHLLTYITKGQEVECDLSKIRLLALGLSLTHTVVLDLVKDPLVQQQDESVLHTERFQKEFEQFQTNAAKLSQIYFESLKLAVKLLSSENILTQLFNEETFFSQVVHILSLAIVILHVCSTETDVEDSLRKLYLGKLSFPCEREKTPMKEINKDKKKSRHKLDETSKTIKLNLKKWHNIVKVKDDKFSMNRDSIKCDMQTFSLVHILLKCIRHEVTFEIFCDLLRIFCLLGKDSASYFYKLMRHLLTVENNIRVLHHVLDGQQLIMRVLELVRFYQDGITGQPTACLPQEIVTNVQENSFEVPSPFLDIDKLKKSELELILESGRQLAGQSDLDWLRSVISSKEPGWNDLLTLGLKNEDFLNWWNDGFFEIVSQNASILVTEENVQHVFHVTCEGLLHHGQLEIAANLNLLFKKMFYDLSTPAQEDIVLSVISNTDSSESITHFQRQVSEEAVISELIPLLNKLTAATVQEHISTILYLCLYQPDVVIKQAVHMAVGNQAQVGLIVDVLRQFPNICKSCRTQVEQSRLIKSCSDVLKSCTINDSITKNASDFLTQLIKSHTIKLDSKSDISIKLPGLLTPADVLHYFVLPALKDDACHPVTGSEINVGLPEPSHTEQAVLRQNLSLHILLSLLANTEKSAITSLQPFPMLIVLVNLYLENYFVFSDGQLEIGKLAIKQSSHLCLVRLIQVVSKFSKIFPESSYYWLRKQCMISGRMHLAVLKPVLDHCCDLETQNLLVSLMGQMHSTSAENVKFVMLLTRLAIVNDEMLLEVQHFVQHVKFTTNSRIMVIVIQQLLLMSLPAEIHRLVHLVEVLVECLVFKIPGVSDVSLENSSGSSTVSSSVAQLLTDAAILNCTDVRCHSALCHVANNYLAATQALVLSRSQDMNLLTELLVHHCQLLSCTSGQTCHVLQMSALDLMMKLKSLGGSRSGKLNAVSECDILKIRDHINCIQDEGVKNVLVKQLQEVTKIKL